MKLFENLLSIKNTKENKTAVLNYDDEYAQRLMGYIDDFIQIKTFGFSIQSDYFATDIKTSINGTEFKVNNKPVKINLLGKHNTYNALASIVVAENLGIKFETAVKGLSVLKGVPGRLQRIDAGQNFYAFVDFAYTQESLEKALKTLGEFKKSKIITVFGCGGQRDRTKRPLMGKTACELSDRVILTNDNPRKESPQQIFDDIKKGITKFDNYEIIPDREKAIYKAVETANADDIILVSGKGHEDYQLFADKTIHFDDSEILKQAILKKIGEKNV